MINYKEKLRRTERKNRDAFRKLMEEHVADGSLTAKAHWRDYCSKVLYLLCSFLEAVRKEHLNKLSDKELLDTTRVEIKREKKRV